jgi:hypothetical protein
MICERADQFFDGELDAEAAATFRAHLPDCAGCRQRVFDAMMLEVVGQTAAEAEAAKATAEPLAAGAAPTGGSGGDILPLAFFRRNRRALQATGFAALAAAAAVLVLLVRPQNDHAPIVVAVAETRPIEPRLSWPGADRHRPHAVMRSGAARPHEPVPLAALSRLEKRGDLVGLADGEILAGELDRAAELLERQPASPEVLSDRAALALVQGQPERALELADAALRAGAGAQAEWNLAMALRDLGLSRSAAAQFDKVVARGEPGWAAEAQRRASALRDQLATLAGPQPDDRPEDRPDDRARVAKLEQLAQTAQARGAAALAAAYRAEAQQFNNR